MHDSLIVETTGRAAEPKVLRFAEVLSPVSPEEFLAEYWAKRPLHIPGSPDKFAALLDRNKFVKCAAQVDALQAYMANEDRTGHAAIITILPRQIAGMYKAGLTICAKGLEKGSLRLAEFAHQIKSELNYTGKVDFRGYLSKHGSGAPIHFDARHATTLQIEGEKVWRFSTRPSVHFPPRNAVLEGTSVEYVKTDPLPRVRDLKLEPPLTPPADLQMDEVTLQPGDVLYLPPGTWHSAQAIGHSLAVNMAFNYAKGGTALELLADVLYTMLYADPKWRMTPPPVTEAVSDGQLPASVREFLAERFDDARRAFAELDVADPRVEAVWRRRVQVE